MVDPKKFLSIQKKINNYFSTIGEKTQTKTNYNDHLKNKNLIPILSSLDINKTTSIPTIIFQSNYYNCIKMQFLNKLLIYLFFYLQWGMYE